jgi:hypothetical protein
MATVDTKVILTGKLKQQYTILYSSEDYTTRYWREQQARGKLQIAEETEQWANCCNKHLEIEIQFETSGRRPL